MKPTSYDIMIVGGGMVGSTLACLLANGFANHTQNKKRRIALIEAFEPVDFDANKPYDLRVSAISRISQQVLQQAGAWQSIEEKRISPYEAMHVWDATGEGKIHFSAAEIGEPNLGHIIENQVIQTSLAEQAKHHPAIDWLCPNTLKELKIDDDLVTATLDNGSTINAPLIVGADGARSQLRTLAKIEVERQDYGQHGLVAVIGTEKPNQATAWQRFLPTGPLAFLPLADGSSSIVWTLPADRCPAYLAMSDDKFIQSLGEAFEHKLGNITSISKRVAFPFYGTQAKQYVKKRIALIGDAAHTIHPLAGQGVNLGIKDAAELAKQLLNSTSTDLGSLKLLRKYERARRGDNVATMRAMEGFRLLFGHSASTVVNVRNFGLNALDKMPMIKNKIIRKAMGV